MVDEARRAAADRASRLVMLALFVTAMLAAGQDLKQQAKAAYEQMLYPKAQALARQATEANPDDAEAWFLLGWYTHYRSYDSRPLSGFTRATSDSILRFLGRAVQLDSTLGDAYYFIGAEYGCRFREALCRGDVKQAKADLRAGRARGGYPDWALEYCRNMLRLCAKDAILIVDGDIVVNGVSYLQLVERYRPDVTVMYMLSVPSYALLFKTGIPGAVVPAPISLSREQILGRQTFPWATDTVRVRVKAAALEELGLSSPDTVFEWEVATDSSSPWIGMHTALLLDMVETNRWRRPMCFASGYRTPADIDSCLQDCGLVRRLLPVRVADCGIGLDTLTMQRVFLGSSSYGSIADHKQHPMPRASGILYNYFNCLLTLATHYNRTGNTSDYDAVVERMAALGPPFYESVIPNYQARIDWLRQGMPPAEQ